LRGYRDVEDRITVRIPDDIGIAASAASDDIFGRTVLLETAVVGGRLVGVTCVRYG